MLSIVIPVYRNEESLPDLLAELGKVAESARQKFDQALEVVFVVDGSPDRCFSLLSEKLPDEPFASKLLLHSRNFGSFSAIRTGLQAASGDYFSVLAADLQEPPELAVQFLEVLAGGQFDVVVGCRETRDDPVMSRLASDSFWRLYRKFVIPEIPEKGVDVFGCNRTFRDHLCGLNEANSSLIGLIFWLGFRRAEVSYSRAARKHGKSAWTFKKKLNYLLDSIFSFTDLPIRLLTLVGLIGLAISIVLGIVILLAKSFGSIAVPGYSATVLTIIFFGGLNALGLGIVGSYAWRTYENTKQRPLAVVMRALQFAGRSGDDRNG